jgi:hypothetical protein
VWGIVSHEPEITLTYTLFDYIIHPFHGSGYIGAGITSTPVWILVILHTPFNVFDKRLVKTSEWLTFAELYPYIQISGLI